LYALKQRRNSVLEYINHSIDDAKRWRFSDPRESILLPRDHLDHLCSFGNRQAKIDKFKELKRQIRFFESSLGRQLSQPA
jgi:hypothetical protein